MGGLYATAAQRLPAHGLIHGIRQNSFRDCVMAQARDHASGSSIRQRTPSSPSTYSVLARSA